MFSTRALIIVAATFAPLAEAGGWQCYYNLGCSIRLDATHASAIAAGCTEDCDSGNTYYECFEKGASGARLYGDSGPDSCFMNKYDCWTDCECSKDDYEGYGTRWYNPAISTGAAMAQVVDGEWKTGYEMCFAKPEHSTKGPTISASIWGHSYYSAYKRESPPAYVSNPSYTSDTGITVGYQCEVYDFSGCPGSGIVGGDPHFQTLSGEKFDFHGECDLVFLEAPSLDMTIQIRTKIKHTYSYVESAVLSINGETIEVGDYGSVIVNGVYNADDRELPATVGGYPLELEVSNKKTHAYRILLGDDKYIQLKSFKFMVGVSIDLPREHLLDSSGILGSLKHHGQKLGRDGATLFTDPIEFGQEWIVQESDPVLFEAPAEHPGMCVMPDASAEGRRLGGAMAREEAEAACKNWTMNKEACIYDVMATGDVDMAANAF